MQFLCANAAELQISTAGAHYAQEQAVQVGPSALLSTSQSLQITAQQISPWYLCE